ncbi:MAG: hypothetical protein ACREOZ_02245 [Gloeomargaritales cyanobacterium]
MTEFTEGFDTDDSLDFDQFWAGELKKRKRVKVLGEWLPIPNDIPLALEQKMHHMEVGNAAATKDVMEALYGEGIYDKWYSRGITLKQLTVILAWSLSRIQGQELTFQEVSEKMEDIFASGKV